MRVQSARANYTDEKFHFQFELCNKKCQNRKSFNNGRSHLPPVFYLEKGIFQVTRLYKVWLIKKVSFRELDMKRMCGELLMETERAPVLFAPLKNISRRFLYKATPYLPNKFRSYIHFLIPFNLGGEVQKSMQTYFYH